MLLATLALLSQAAGPCADEAPVAEEPADALGFVAISAYADSRRMGTLTPEVLARMPRSGLELFAFANIDSALHAERPWELERLYGEAHLRWTFARAVPIDLQVQASSATGPDNDALRGGLRWRVHDTPWLDGLTDDLGFAFLFFELSAPQLDAVNDGSLRPMIETVYAWSPPIEALGKRLVVSGFADHGFRLGGAAGAPRTWVVTEHQVAVRAVGRVHLAVEGRYNAFLPKGSRSGVAMGIRVDSPWRSP